MLCSVIFILQLLSESQRYAKHKSLQILSRLEGNTGKVDDFIAWIHYPSHPPESMPVKGNTFAALQLGILENVHCYVRQIISKGAMT